MAIKDLKIKVKENKSDGSFSSPKFSISMKQSSSSDENRANSYEVLSALKGDSDIIIEVNSSLLNIPPWQRETYAKDFLYSVRELGLDYRYKKGVSQSSLSFLAQLFGFGKNNQSAHEILAYVPHSVWESENFYKILPIHGARYYVLKEPGDSSKILDQISNMLDEEKLDYFKFTVFDTSTFSYMGINGNNLTIDDIKRSLGM